MLLPYLATLAAFVTGVCLFHGWFLPSVLPLGALLFITLIFWGRRQGWLLIALLAGLLWAGWRADLLLADRLDPVLAGQQLEVIGHVAGLPQTTRFGTRFIFKPATVLTPQATLPERIQIHWYGPPDRVRAGEIWRLTIRPRLPHGQINPGGFDLESWFVQQGIGATATVKAGERQPGMAAGAWLTRIRAALRERIRNAIPQAPYQGVIVALTIGDQSGIEPVQWQRFAATGITHLISISGLHITMLAGFSAWLAHWAWRRIPTLVARFSAPRAALIAGVFTALVYCLLAGMAVPTQRTLFMLLVAAVCLWRSRPMPTSAIWMTALAVVVVIDPLAVLSVGFWLSFMTVGALLWAGRHRQIPLWRGWALAQATATLASAPILLVVFGQLPLLSPLANAVAIPLVSMAVTPLALAGLLFTPLLWLAEKIFAATDWFLHWCEMAPQIAFTPPPLWTLAPALVGVLLGLLPRGFPAKWLAPIFLLPLFLIRPALLPEGVFRATVLDVGQGLSVLVETRRSATLFDTGSPSNGERVGLPALRALGRHSLDTLILSHNDADHAGDAAVLLPLARQVLHQIPPASPLLQGKNAQLCEQGQRWQVDGVKFEIAWPPAGFVGKDDNAQSCVLRVDNGRHSVLIPADIGRNEELLLAPQLARADVLIAPHHGSRTSSSQELIDAVQARHAIVSAGYFNRYRHPNQAVVARYQAAGAQIWRTDRDGAVEILAGDDLLLSSWREKRQRWWSAPRSPQISAEGSRPDAG